MFSSTHSAESSASRFASRALRSALVLACLFLCTPVTAQAEPSEPFERTIVVSPTLGDPMASGRTLLDAVANTTPTPEDHWLIRIEPGIYDLGSSSLRMKPWLDVEGSGTGITIIRGLGQRPESFNRGRGVVIGADDSEIRDLTIRCVTDEPIGRSLCITVANPFASPRLANLRLISEDFGSHWGLRNTGAAPELEDVEIVLSGGTENYGIVNADGSRPTIRRAQINVRDGQLNNFGIFDRDGSLSAVVDDSEINVFGGEFAAGMFAADLLASDEIRMVDVKMAVEGALENYGILDGDLHLLLRSTRIHAGAPGSSIDLGDAGETRIFNSELSSESFAVRAAYVQVGSTLIVGGGAVTGTVEQTCGGVAVFASSRPAFYAESCPNGIGVGGQRLSGQPSLRAGYTGELDALQR